MTMMCSPGRYVVKIMDHSLTEAKTGTLQIAFQIEIQGQIDPENPEELFTDHAGITRTIFRPITAKTQSWVWQDLDKLGYKGDDFDPLDKEKAAAANKEFVSLAGQLVHARCTPNNFGDKESESWNFDMGGGMNLTAADQSKVREANAMFGRKKVQQKTGAKSPATAVPAGAKIPF